MNIREYVQAWMNDFGASVPKINPVVLDTEIMRSRLLDYSDIANYAGHDEVVEIDPDTGQVPITLRDIFNTYQYYAGNPRYFLHPFGLYFDANGSQYVDGSGAPFDWDPAAFTLGWYAAFSGATVVKAVGHLVDINCARYQAAGLLLNALAAMPSVRGTEFDNLHKRVASARDDLFGSRIVRCG